uniref:F-box domain-containing protein n=1 Tax=Kalanchoe fedtschenkoi TaxID=63787 RepID=A0A7N0UYZ4_KALFE
MAGRRRKKIKLSAETVTVKDATETATVENVETMEQLRRWSDLPPELLELILSRLKLDDNLRASAVCKSWNEVACVVRVVSQSPWIMYFNKSSDLYEFYDPTSRKIHLAELPELAETRACYTKDGWLLLYKLGIQSLFFFNPFTREMIGLPTLKMTYQIVAFSAAPTSPDCILFTLKHVTPEVVAVSTCRPGATEWTTVNYENRYSFVSSVWNKLVFCSGKFYCFSLTGWLGVYDPVECSWDVVSVLPPKCPESFFAKNWWKGKFMAEYNGEIFVIYTCSNENPILYKLDEANLAWKETKTLDGVTLFASFLTSHSRIDLLGLRRNSIYFSKVRFYGKRCILYSLDDCRYYPHKQRHDWGEQNPFESIWIEPPKDFTGFT